MRPPIQTKHTPSTLSSTIGSWLLLINRYAQLVARSFSRGIKDRKDPKQRHENEGPVVL